MTSGTESGGRRALVRASLIFAAVVTVLFTGIAALDGGFDTVWWLALPGFFVVVAAGQAWGLHRENTRTIDH